jgi:hypothetical protein
MDRSGTEIFYLVGGHGPPWCQHGWQMPQSGQACQSHLSDYLKKYLPLIQEGGANDAKPNFCRLDLSAAARWAKRNRMSSSPGDRGRRRPCADGPARRRRRYRRRVTRRQSPARTAIGAPAVRRLSAR